ncbi:EAL domain-containing protein [Paenibacillus rhizovicinus]|uniref:EAL domain-containing protein n=1 Tax=Paenibacillus rhizovicinus TaxID=2704463 RepID=A0A6C0P6F6_9BACL|nr:EAL domain-containing protein [Paenibacillus rhizovicinus]QHW34164.1 EAL domain-containing protein [Paenibacillus rhizovicinus]
MPDQSIHEMKGSRKRVLVVDDSAVMRTLIQSILEQDPQFLVVGTASNGQEAIERIAELLPDLVTMDVEMPVMDGVSALQYIMAENPVPVIVLSTHTEEGTAIAFEALALGAADFFHKDKLFGESAERQSVEEFLMRCKAALGTRLFWRLRERWDGIGRTLRQMIGFMVDCYNKEASVTASLNRAIDKLSGLAITLKRDEAGNYYYAACSGSFTNRFGFLDSYLVGKRTDDLFTGDFLERLLELYRRAWSGEEYVSYELEWRGIAVQGILQPVKQDGRVVEVYGILIDLTEQKRLKDQVEYISNHDSLTGLPDRRQMPGAMEELAALGSPFAVLCINLDQFKLVTDTFGHEVGDRLLILVARRLKSFAREQSVLFRAGNDEFILLTLDTTIEAAEHLGTQILRSLRHPVRIDGHEIHMSSSIGICLCPDDLQQHENLLRYAHIAMTKAKEGGGNRCQSFEPSFHEQIQRRITIEHNLRKAIERKEFVLHYQPQIDTRTNRVIGLESLIRWESPEFGRISPAEFIPVAEESELIYLIGEWALREACHQNARWQEEGRFHVPIAVNLSSRQFYDQKLKEGIEAILTETGMDPQYLVLEITESMTMHVQKALSALRSLKSLGVHVAMDDFGTGYSSLAYLKEFPIDKLKIDQSFVKGIRHHPANASIVSAIISMAASLNLEIIAEGVETMEQLVFLGGQGCGVMQGYWFSHPLEANRVPDFIAKFNAGGNEWL